MNYFIYTEIINCGKIGKIAIDSFVKYHPNLEVNIYGTTSDFVWLKDHADNPNIKAIPVPDPVKQLFNRGHHGTATLWASVIKNRPEKFLIHFDSDVIFRDNVFDDIIEKTKEYDLIGCKRNYKNNPCNADNVRHLADVCATGCFCFNKELIDDRDFHTLIRMCEGAFNPLGHPTLDFFDPVMFEMLKNGAKIYFLDFNEFGGCNGLGSRDNEFKELNNEDTPFKIEFGSKLAHFSAVGSGMNIYNNPAVETPYSYKQYALDRYALFCKIFYNEDIGIDVSKYKNVLNVKKWF